MFATLVAILGNNFRFFVMILKSKTMKKKNEPGKTDFRDLKLIIPQKHVKFKIQFFMKILKKNYKKKLCAILMVFSSDGDNFLR